MLPTQWGSNLQPPDPQLDVLPTESLRLARNGLMPVGTDYSRPDKKILLSKIWLMKLSLFMEIRNGRMILYQLLEIYRVISLNPKSANQKCSRHFYFLHFFMTFWFFFFFLHFFRENKTWHFMWIIYQADNGHEMPSLIFSEKILICYNFAEQTIHMKCKILFSLKNNKQEAHGQCLAHLSEIATADMQILCNIFSILSLQLIKGSSFEQFLVLKKNVFVFFIIIILPYMGMTVNGAWPFEQTLNVISTVRSTQIAQRFARRSQRLVFKIVAVAAILDFQSAWL